VWFQNARAKYRRNTLKQEQQERSGNGVGGGCPINQASGPGGDAASTVGDVHSTLACTPPPRAQRPGQRGPSRSPASLSDLSSTPSTSNDPQPGIGGAAAAQTAGLIMMDFERRPSAIVESMSMFGAPGFLVDNC